MWIPFRRSRHRATYDENGDIILGEDCAPAETEAVRKESAVSDAWLIEEPPSPEQIFDKNDVISLTLDASLEEPLAPIADHLSSVRQHITTDVLEEGLRQYRESFASATPLLREFREETRSLMGRFRDFFTQPVWVPNGKRNVKQTSRGTLFFFDMFRFGGTFAGIFLMLFLSLNYQSFWDIARAHVEPLLAPASMDQQTKETSAELREKLKLLPSLAMAGGRAGDLLSFLPPVGPPDNRLILPKLDLNVPLVNPPYAALIKGDWAQVEKDIQEALVNGVVHYPGTANPGQAGNFFVTGHSSYYPWAPGKYKSVFSRLQDLQVGDEYWVYYGGDKYRYVVRTKKEVSPSDITVLDQPTDERISTLMTCTPVGTTLRRLIIVATEVDTVTGLPLGVGELGTQPATKVNLESLPI